MKYEIVPNSCRICLRKCKKLRSIYKPLEEGDRPPSEMLKLITGIAVEKDTGAHELPRNICKSCELSLNLAFQFRSKALKSHRILEIFCNHQKFGDDEMNRLDMKDNQFLQPKSEMDSPAFLKDEILSPNESDETICTEEDTEIFTIEMKVEDLEIPFCEEAKLDYINDETNNDEFDAIEQNESINNSLGVEESSITIEKQEIVEAEEVEVRRMENGKYYIKEKLSRSKKSKYDIAAIKQRNNDGTLKTMSILAKKQGRSKVDDENSHICDICGNIYAKRGRLMEHRRRHDPELRFACELCDKRFQLREKLRKHMFSHGGRKPYQCSFCSRTFIYESVKKAHEAVHNGVKPYVCEICKKAFAYSHALKKHKLIHADIKLYHCEYCDKDFRLQHHMKQHEETKLHQNAVKHQQETRVTSILS